MRIARQQEKPTGFELALVRARVPLIAALMRRGFTRDRAEDLAQEAAVKALEARDRFDESRPILPWLLVIALRVNVDAGRRPEPEPTEAGSVDPAELAILREEQQRMTTALDHLPHVQREVLGLFYREGLSVGEVARRLGLKEGTVKSHLHRARAELARRLSESAR